ncbi:MAG TPA: hypothetical protein ENI51_04460, partial [Candidatus Atribacteria bacterium]|nr:hypothetical protein [Candidatus Atribacteria bacterium]
MRIVWLSANLFGYELLKEVLKIKGAEVVAIITLSDKSKTRMYDGIERKKWYDFNIPVYEIENINKEIKLLKSLYPDIIMVCGWRQIINKETLNIPKEGVIGFHPALLPKGRGSAPIINTILEGYKKSGVTMFYLNEKVDAGDIIGQVEFDIGEEDYAMDIYRKIIRGGKRLLRKYLPLLIEGNAPRAPQDEKKATYFKKRTPKDNEINLDKDSPDEISKKIRAFSYPYLGA